MHIRRELPTVHTMSDGNNTIQLETITLEKDLDVWVTKNLKPTEQCIQATKKAKIIYGQRRRKPNQC